MGDVVTEVRGKRCARTTLQGRRDVELDGRSHRHSVIHRCDLALFQHPVQHQIAPLERSFRIGNGVVDAGSIHQTGQEGRLGQGQVHGGGAEEVTGRGLDAVGVPVEKHNVQVALKDLVLAEALLQFQGKLDFAQFVAHGLLAAEHHIFRAPFGQA
ncbi:hypothetical protein D3C73_1131360 [compost metagenome]